MLPSDVEEDQFYAGFITEFNRHRILSSFVVVLNLHVAPQWILIPVLQHYLRGRGHLGQQLLKFDAAVGKQLIDVVGITIVNLPSWRDYVNEDIFQFAVGRGAAVEIPTWAGCIFADS